MKRIFGVLVSAILVMALCSPGTAYAADHQAADGEGGSSSYQSLYASVIFSMGNDGVSSAVTLPLEKLKEFPYEDDTGRIYGALVTTGSRPSEQGEGKQAADHIETLFKYHYLETTQYGTDFSSGGADTNIAAQMGAIGQTIYGVCNSIVSWVGQAVTAINFVNLFNINIGSGVPMDAAGYGGDDPESTGTLGYVIKQAFVDAGIDETLLNNVMQLTFLIFTIIFCITFVFALVSVRGRRQKLTRVGGWGLRLATIICSFPLAIALTSVCVDIGASVQEFTADQLKLTSESIVVDTLAFAGQYNFDLDKLGVDPKDPDNYDFSDFNKELAKKGLVDENISITHYLSNETATVEDYAAWAASQPGAASSDLGKFDGLRGSIKALVGRDVWNQAYSVGGSKANPNLVFFQKSPKTEDESPGDGSDTFIDNNGSKDVPDYHTYGSTLSTHPFALFDGGSATLYTYSSDAYTTQSVSAKDLSSYIYGATPSKNASEQTSSKFSFIFTGQQRAGDQLVNPVSGKAIKSYSKDTIDDAVFGNAVGRAVLNKNAGIVGNSLSTQSVAFLLQTTYQDGSLKYNAYTVPSSSAGESVNTGENGTIFKRYVIPHETDAQLAMKIGQLNVAWLSAGWAALLGMLALLTAPVLGAVWKSLRGTFRALFKGDPFGLAEYAIYLIALYMSFIFYQLATLCGVAFVSMFSLFTDVVTGGLTSAAGSAGGWFQGIWGLEAIGDVAGTIVSGFGFIVLSIIICVILTWPITSMQVNGGQKQMNLVSAVVTIPYSFAEGLCGSFDMYRQRLFGRGVMNNSEAESPGGVIKRRLGTAAKAGAVVAGAGAVGSIAMKAGSAAAAGAGAEEAGAAGKALAGVKGAVGAVKDVGGDVMGKASNVGSALASGQGIRAAKELGSLTDTGYAKMAALRDQMATESPDASPTATNIEDLDRVVREDESFQPGLDDDNAIKHADEAYDFSEMEPAVISDYAEAGEFDSLVEKEIGEDGQEYWAVTGQDGERRKVPVDTSGEESLATGSVGLAAGTAESTTGEVAAEMTEESKVNETKRKIEELKAQKAGGQDERTWRERKKATDPYARATAATKAKMAAASASAAETKEAANAKVKAMQARMTEDPEQRAKRIVEKREAKARYKETVKEKGVRSLEFNTDTKQGKKLNERIDKAQARQKGQGNWGQYNEARKQKSGGARPSEAKKPDYSTKWSTDRVTGDRIGRRLNSDGSTSMLDSSGREINRFY